MKFAFSFLILCLFSFSSSAQTPDYFGENPSWSTSMYYGPMLDLEMIGWTDKIVFSFDGTFDSGMHTYHMIQRRTYRTPLVGTDGPEDCDVPLGSVYEMRVRQEGNAIYFFTEGVDSLFISYDLEIGDTIGGYFGAINPDLTVCEIDSVLVNEMYRKVFFTDSLDPFNPHLIEGIGHFGGSSGYYFGSAASYGEYWELDAGFHFKCYAENHTPKWPTTDPELAYCFSLLSIEDHELQNLPAYSVYPNPATNLIFIQNTTLPIRRGTILDVDGRILEHLNAQQMNEPINISQLNTGLFILQIEEENGEIRQLKFVKN